MLVVEVAVSGIYHVLHPIVTCPRVVAPCQLLVDLDNDHVTDVGSMYPNANVSTAPSTPVPLDPFLNGVQVVVFHMMVMLVLSCGVVWCGVVCCGVVWCVVVCCGVVWRW